MEHIKEIKKIKTFESLLVLRDKYDMLIESIKVKIGEVGYSNYMSVCKYRNMIEKRIIFLEKQGAKIDQI